MEDKAEKDGEGEGKKDGKKVKFSQQEGEENARCVYNLCT